MAHSEDLLLRIKLKLSKRRLGSQRMRFPEIRFVVVWLLWTGKRGPRTGPFAPLL